MVENKVVIYTKSYCPFSKECKQFLNDKGIAFDEKVVDSDPAMEAEMKHKSGERSDTPQVFINSHLIGSFDDLKALEASGKLNEVLEQS